ncbi:MAG: hypothetical protein C0467_02640 [Planctomycetaceae bacterium]|nr:hypothetical protein [Planctomycetaceae bacterium]
MVPNLRTVLAGCLLTVGLFSVTAAAQDPKKKDDKGDPAVKVALTQTSAVQLLPDYTQRTKKGTDSAVGELVRKDGLTISYDIGWYGAQTLENTLWSKEQMLFGKKVKIVFSKQKELLVVVGAGEKVHASFYSKVKSEEDVAEILLIVLSYTHQN